MLKKNYIFIQVLEVVRSCKAMQLIGLHCHIGSTITDVTVFRDVATILADIAISVSITKRLFYSIPKLNLLEEELPCLFAPKMCVYHVSYTICENVYFFVYWSYKRVSVAFDTDVISALNGRLQRHQRA